MRHVSPCSIYIISAIIHDYCSLNAGYNSQNTLHERYGMLDVIYLILLSYHLSMNVLSLSTAALSSSQVVLWDPMCNLCRCMLFV